MLSVDPSVDPDDLHKKGRANDLSSGKGLICYLGTTNLASTGRNCPGILVYSGLQSGKPSSEVKNLQKIMILNY